MQFKSGVLASIVSTLVFYFRQFRFGTYLHNLGAEQQILSLEPAKSKFPLEISLRWEVQRLVKGRAAARCRSGLAGFRTLRSTIRLRRGSSRPDGRCSSDRFPARGLFRCSP